MTVLEVLQSSTGYLQKRGVESARLNAEHLVAHVLGLTRMQLYLEFERALTEAELAPLRELMRRRGQREPLQHLLGTVEFCGLTLKCDKRALIPRPETEELVELLEKNLEARKPGSVLDVGTGSGAIALALASKFPTAEVDAIDISPDALSLARENAELLGLTNRIRFIESDLFAKADGVYDLIVANLPYVAAATREELAAEVLRDPEIALFGGDDGLDVIRAFAVAIPNHLQRNGMLALEIGLGQAEEVCGLLRAQNFHDIETKADYQGIPRFVLARHG